MKESDVGDLNIVAIGGGGFTHATYPSLDTFCLRQTGKDDPKVGFIATASQDDVVKIDRFHARFGDLVTHHEHLPMDWTAERVAEELARLDLVYVGGGNTQAMVADWRKTGWDQALRDAAFDGLTLAGVSAGAVCWFDSFLFSSGNGPMRPLPGLGLLKGGACPHYATEPERKGALHAAVAAKEMPRSIAIDDGVAVAFGPDGPTKIHSAEPTGGAFEVRRGPDGTAHEAPLTL